MLPYSHTIEYAEILYNPMRDEPTYRVKFQDQPAPIMVDLRQLVHICEMEKVGYGAEHDIHRNIDAMLRQYGRNHQSYRADFFRVRPMPPRIRAIETGPVVPYEIGREISEWMSSAPRFVVYYEGSLRRETMDQRELIHWIDEDITFYGRRRDIDLVRLREMITGERISPVMMTSPEAWRERTSPVPARKAETPAPAPGPKPEPPPTSPFKNFEI